MREITAIYRTRRVKRFFASRYFRKIGLLFFPSRAGFRNRVTFDAPMKFAFLPS